MKAEDIARLHAEFLKEFTIMGSGKPLDELIPPEDLWQWIIENFVENNKESSDG